MLRRLLLPALLILPLLFQGADALALSKSDRAIYLDAFALLADGKPDEALQRGRQAKDPLLAEVLLWRKLTHPAETIPFADAADFLAAHPGWPGQTALRRAAEQSLPENLPETAVLAWFGAQPPVTAAGTLRYAKALLAAGRQAEAHDLARTAWVERDLPRDLEREFEHSFGHLLTPQDDSARLERLIWDRADGQALRLAKRLGPGVHALTEARLKLARMEPGVDGAIARVPESLRNDSGLIYERALWRLRKDRYADAVALLDPPIPDAAHPDEWWGLRRWASRRALQEGDISLAYRISAHHGLDRGVGFAEGEFLAGWISLRYLREPARALEHFARLYERVSTPISQSRGAFWAGEAARAKDERETAELWYRRAAVHDTTFYGQLAGLRLGAIPAGVSQPPAEPDAAQRQAFEQRDLVKILRQLAELGLTEEQTPFFAMLRVTASSEQDYRLVADLAVDLKRYDEAVRTAKTAVYEGAGLLRGHLFPLPDLKLADGRLAPPALVMGLIRQESTFDAAAISPAGARGLMQLMPGTAKTLAQRLKTPYDQGRLTDDPAYNVALGRAYLEEMIARYDGFLPLAIAAYNAGPARVDRWLREFGDPRDPAVDTLDWIETIPFSETRNYVQRVLEGMNVYSRLLAPDGDPFAGLPHPLQTSARIEGRDGSAVTHR